MPRASDGTYTLPAGNPVTTLTTVSSTVHNNTMSDVASAMTASLSRNGEGAMLAPLDLDAGTVSAPSLAFSAEPTLGLYRVGAGVLGVAVGLAKIAEFKAGGLEVAVGQILTPLGTAAAPPWAFTGDTNTGMFSSGADTIDLATGGTSRFSISTTAITSTLALSATSITSGTGTAAAPTYTFTGDTNTGMSAAVADTLVLSTGGTARLTLSTTALTAALKILMPDGTAADPGIGFTNDTNVGLFRPSGGELGMTLAGTGFFVGYRNVPINTQNINYTTVLSDQGKTIYKASGGVGETITIPANSSVAYNTGTVLTFVNVGGGDLTIAITTDTMTQAGTGSTGSRTLANNGIATAIKLTATTWLISGTGLS